MANSVGRYPGGPMTDLIARVKKALEFEKSDYYEIIFNENPDVDRFSLKTEASFFSQGAAREQARTAKLIKALFEFFAFQIPREDIDWSEWYKRRADIEAALEEMEKK